MSGSLVQFFLRVFDEGSVSVPRTASGMKLGLVRLRRPLVKGKEPLIKRSSQALTPIRKKGTTRTEPKPFGSFWLPPPNPTEKLKKNGTLYPRTAQVQVNTPKEFHLILVRPVRGRIVKYRVGEEDASARSIRPRTYVGCPGKERPSRSTRHL